MNIAVDSHQIWFNQCKNSALAFGLCFAFEFIASMQSKHVVYVVMMYRMVVGGVRVPNHALVPTLNCCYPLDIDMSALCHCLR